MDYPAGKNIYINTAISYNRRLLKSKGGLPMGAAQAITKISFSGIMGIQPAARVPALISLYLPFLCDPMADCIVRYCLTGQTDL